VSHVRAFDYASITPLEARVPADRQGAKRHYGVHPYFTRRPWNVVRAYIRHYTRPGDVVLDPFSGSGVAPIEALLEGRVGVQNDINPLANFIASGIAGLTHGHIGEYRSALDALEARCRADIERLEGQTDAEVQRRLASLPLPANVELPRNSDVERYHELFTARQLAGLAIVRQAINELPGAPARAALLLAWSAALSKLNRTFLSAKGRAESRGGSSIFSIYRYKVAAQAVELPVWATFAERARNVIAAKLEMDQILELKRRTRGRLGRFEAHAEDVPALAERFAGQVDYVFTDPPYGGHIAYLDLSTLWNNWLGHMPSTAARERELIVGGELEHGEQRYLERLRSSIEACLRMLKPQRWLSVVFQHWNVAYFEAILAGAAGAGGELRAAVSQVGDPIWSMHKKKGSESVLAGEMILTFCKSGAWAPRRRDPAGFSVEQALRRALADATDEHVYGEALFNTLVIEAWRQDAIAALNVTREGFADLMRACGWSYDPKEHCWLRSDQSRKRALLHSP
jgi:16S rRNA G966 N2-methylase RsmD